MDDWIVLCCVNVILLFLSLQKTPITWTFSFLIFYIFYVKEDIFVINKQFISNQYWGAKMISNLKNSTLLV